MNKTIFTIKIGDNPNWNYCIKSQIEYCKKYKINYHIIDSFKIYWRWGPNPTANFYFEKLQVVDLFLNSYTDQILYLDSDILITPHARNIFELYNDPNTYYGFDESMDIGIQGSTMFGTTDDIMNRDPYVKTVINVAPNWKKNTRGKYIYYNMGVMLFGRGCLGVFGNTNKVLELKDTPRIYDFNDQTYFNAIIQKHNIPNESIDYSFNRMHLGKYDPNKERYKADFIHYAGQCLYNIDGEYSEEGKRKAVIKDYNHFYGS